MKAGSRWRPALPPALPPPLPPAFCSNTLNVCEWWEGILVMCVLIEGLYAFVSSHMYTYVSAVPNDFLSVCP